MCFRTVRIETDGFAVVVNCLVEVTFSEVCDTSAIIRWGQFWLESNGFGAVVNGRFVFAQLDMTNSSIAMRLSIFRSEPNGFRIRGNRFLKFALRGKIDASIVGNLGRRKSDTTSSASQKHEEACSRCQMQLIWRWVRDATGKCGVETKTLCQ